MAKKKSKKKTPFIHLGLSWQAMKIGRFQYDGTYTGAKANVCRANRSYFPKRWRTHSADGMVFVERLS